MNQKGGEGTKENNTKALARLTWPVERREGHPGGQIAKLTHQYHLGVEQKTGEKVEQRGRPHSGTGGEKNRTCGSGKVRVRIHAEELWVEKGREREKRKMGIDKSGVTRSGLVEQERGRKESGKKKEVKKVFTVGIAGKQ